VTLAERLGQIIKARCECRSPEQCCETAQRILDYIQWEAKAFALNAAVASRRDSVTFRTDVDTVDEKLANQNVSDARVYEGYLQEVHNV
jgi:hypothetical protein